LSGYATHGKVTVASGAVLDVSAGGSGWTAANISSLLSSNGTGFAAGSGLGIDTTNGSLAIGGTLSGNMGLVKLGANALTLSATNTNVGNTLISGGTLALGSPLALQESTLDTSGTGTLSFGSLTAVTLGGLTGPGTLVLDNLSSAPIAIQAGNNGASTTFSGELNGAGSLDKIGGGTLILSGSDSYTGGTMVDGGTLSVASPYALPSGTSLTVGARGGLLFEPSAAGLAASQVETVAAVPEPETWVLLAAGLGSAAACRGFRRWKAFGSR
jgi:autotransporter-associated beta strand protein